MTATVKVPFREVDRAAQVTSVHVGQHTVMIDPPLDCEAGDLVLTDPRGSWVGQYRAGDLVRTVDVDLR